MTNAWVKSYRILTGVTGYPTPQMTEMEFDKLTDWVEIEAEKHDLFPDQASVHSETILKQRRQMKMQMTPIDIPVPPAPLLEQAVGYRNYRKAHYLALWWDPCGDEAMVSDGLLTFTGLWSGYLAFVQHGAVHLHLAAYNLGSSENSADFHLVIDLDERRAFISPSKEADHLLATQWQRATDGVCPLSAQEVSLSLSSTDMEKWLEGLEQQLLHFPSMAELLSQIAEDEKCVAALEQWLDDQIQNK